MASRRRFQLVGAIILYMAYIVSAQCPSKCDCSNYGSRKEIRCGSSNLTAIPNNIPVDTQVLRLELNRIQSISSSDLSQLVNLKQLTLYNNMISFIDANAFENQEDLQVLNLKYNMIPSLHVQTFRNMRNLVELHLDNNFLQSLESDIFQGLVKLNELEIDGNPLQSLPNGIFSGLSNLRLLDISNVAFQSIPGALFDGLTNLADLKMNNVTQNGDELFGSENIFSTVPNLNTLEVRQNNLHCFPMSFAMLSSLTVLKLSMNPLTCSNFTGLKDLQHLEELHMDDSGITRLTSNMFVGNTNLVFLLIEYSSLTTVEYGAFNGLSLLEDLYLSSNNLTTLPYNVFDSIPNNVNLEINNNPWDCNCDLRWLYTWLSDSYTGYTPPDRQPLCASPDRLLGQPIIDSTDNDFACMPESEANETMTHTVNEGENYVLKCSITGDPSPALHWLTPDHTELLPNTNEIPFSVDEDCTLTIIRIRKEDAGTYSCTGTNAAGTLSIRNVVNVIGAGNVPQSSTDSDPQSTKMTVTVTTHQSEPLLGANNSTLVVSVALVGIIIILIVMVLLVAFIRRRTKRKNRLPPGADSVLFRNANSTLPGLPSCNLRPDMSIPCSINNERYAETLQRQPTASVFGPPPPYSTIPPSPSDDIYAEIKNDEDLYEKPRDPGDLSPTASIRPGHTYMAQMLRQDSCVSEGSCGAPAGYERSMIRDVGKPTSHRASSSRRCGADQSEKGAQSNLYVDLKDRQDNIPPNDVEFNQQRVRVPDLNPDGKVTYENTRRT